MTKLAYTIPEAAEASGVSIRTINRLLSARKLPPCKIGNRTVIRVTDLQAFIDKQVIQ